MDTLFLVVAAFWPEIYCFPIGVFRRSWSIFTGIKFSDPIVFCLEFIGYSGLFYYYLLGYLLSLQKM